MHRILFVTKSPPVPISIGGNQRANLLWRALSALGSVDLVVMDNMSIAEQENHRQQFNLLDAFALPSAGQSGRWADVRRLAPNWTDRLAHHLGGIQWMYQRNASVSERIEKHLVAGKYSIIVGCPAETMARSDPFRFCPVILDNHDLAASYYQSRLDAGGGLNPGRVLLTRHLRQLKKVLPPLFRRCAAVFISNEKDRLFPGLEKGVLLPNIPFPDHVSKNPFPENDESLNALTVGAYSHKPNEEGVDYFVQHVWPEVRRRVPSAEYRIVGTGITNDMRKKWVGVPGVNVIGFVPDLASEYQSAAFAVVPIQWGAGTNIKVLEALAYGRTCVLAPFARRGYEHTLRHNEALLVAVNAADMREACVHLLEDAVLRARLAAKGCEIVQREYTFEKFCSIVKQSLTPLIASAT